MDNFQKERLQNFFDSVYFYVDTDEKETLLALWRKYFSYCHTVVQITFDLSISSPFPVWESSLNAMTPLSVAFSFQPEYVMVLLAHSWLNAVWISRK